MAIRLFLIPMVDAGPSLFGGTHYEPKYIKDYPDITTFAQIKYSRTSEAIVIIDSSNATLNSIGGESDVITLATPNNIDNTINNNQRDAFRTFLENRDIPAQWVNTGDTRREVIRGLQGLFLFAQRVEGKTNKGLKESFQDAGVGLNTTWSALPQGAKNILLETADSFGWENPGFTGASTVREILKFFSDQWEGTPFVIGGVTI